VDDLADIAEELIIYLRFHVAGAMDAPDPDAVATAADSACTYYQAVAICELLLDAEVDAFFHHMIRSARSRKWLLERAATTAGFPPKPTRASNGKGFFAALVANDWALAKQIADLSPRQWQPTMEYEDDFWYAHLLHRIAAGDAEPALNGALAEYARALEGDEPPRFRLCRALLARTEEPALEAFADLLEDRRKELETMKKTSLLATDDLFPPFAAIYVEGLAWLRLLARAGIATEVEYPFCPSLARAEQYAPFVPDGMLGA
jgi:hypothetical protein